MLTDNQKQSIKNYRKANVKQIVFHFYPSEQNLYNWIKKNGQSEVKKILKKMIDIN